MPPDLNSEHASIKMMLERNHALLEDNNKLLHKMYRYSIISMWLRVIWYVVLIGLPFALYFYVLEPYFTALGASYETFNAGIQEIPGWKQFNDVLKSYEINR